MKVLDWYWRYSHSIAPNQALQRTLLIVAPLSLVVTHLLGQSMDEEIRQFIDQGRREYREKVFFIEQGLGAEVHWFFTQPVQALKSELYLPACTSFLNGIEASLRVTLSQVDAPARVKELNPAKTLSQYFGQFL